MQKPNKSRSTRLSHSQNDKNQSVANVTHCFVVAPDNRWRLKTDSADTLFAFANLLIKFMRRHYVW